MSRRRFVIYGTGSAGVAPGFQAQTVSIDFNGTDELMGQGDNFSLDIGNAWSIGEWIKPTGTTFTAESRILYAITSGGGPNQIRVDILGDVANDPLEVALADSSSLTFKRYRYDSLFTTDTWVHLIHTWDGTDLKLYVDGVETAKSSSTLDNAGTQTDTTRSVYLGASSSAAIPFAGRMHSVGVWDAVLTSGEALDLFNGGKDMDWTAYGNAYNSGADMQHWWRLGAVPSDIGGDSGVGTARDLMEDAENITADDIVTDAPTASTVFVDDISCVDLDGSTEYFENLNSAAGQAFDFTEDFSITYWFKPTAGAFTQEGRLIDCRTVGALNSAIIMDLRGSTSNDPVRVRLWDSTATNFKDYSWDLIANSAVWNCFTLTWSWSSGQLKLYWDGTDTAATATPTDTIGHMVDETDRTMALGAATAGGSRFVVGRIHSVGVWDSVLTDAEQTVLYNAGTGSTVDWSRDTGNYVSSANLQHWWRFGMSSLVIGEDHGVAKSIDMMDDAGGITSADVITDAP